MGIVLLEIESKQSEEFSRWNLTPPYAAIALLGHPGLDLDLVSRANDVRHSQWMSEKPGLRRLDAVYEPVRDRGLQYLWSDHWCRVLEPSGLASCRLEHLEDCYERARWCLVLTTKSLYQQFHWQLHPNGTCNITGWPQIPQSQENPLGLPTVLRKKCSSPGCGTILNRLVLTLFGMNATRLQDHTNLDKNSAIDTSAVYSASSNGPSKTAMPQLGLFNLQGNSDSYCCNDQAALQRSVQGNQITMPKDSVCLRLEAVRKQHKQHSATPCSPHCKYSDIRQSGSSNQEGQSVSLLTGLYERKEALYGFQSQIQQPIPGEYGDSKQHEDYHHYPATGIDTCSQHSPTLQAESRSLDILQMEGKTGAKTLLPKSKPSVSMTATLLLLLGDQFKSSKEVESGKIRSWLDSTHVNPIVNRGDESSEPLTTMDPVNVGDIDMEDIEDRCSESSSKTEYQWQSLDEWAPLAPSLAPIHPLYFVKGTLIHIALSKYLDQKKRQQRSGSQQARTSASFNNQKRLEIACPFYKVDPFKHSSCLKGSRLLTISQVKDHLLQQHRMPFYCPVCKSDFQTAVNRDRHIVKRSCSLREDFPYEGVSDDQRRLLLRRRRRMGPKQHWHKICVLLQLKISKSASPYLMDTTIAANEIMGFRDFWRKHGQTCIADLLMTVNLHHWNRQNEERDLASLYSDILEGASEALIRRHRT